MYFIVRHAVEGYPLLCFFIHLKLKIMLSSYWSLLQICIFRSFQIAVSLEVANRVLLFAWNGHFGI